MKKGQAHIEMVIATTIFILSITLLLFYLNPTISTTNTANILSAVENSFKEQVYTNLTKIFIVNTGEKNCLSMDLANLNLEGNSYVEDSLSKNSVESQFSGGILKINSPSRTFSILISKDIQAKSISCSSPSTSFELGSIKASQIISATKLEKFQTDYNKNYEELKNKIEIPSNIDFTITSDLIILQSSIPEKIEVQSKKIKEDILYSNGSIESKEFIIKIW